MYIHIYIMYTIYIYMCVCIYPYTHKRPHYAIMLPTAKYILATRRYNLLVHLPTTKLDTISGSINIFSILTSISPGKETSRMNTSLGLANRKRVPVERPTTTPISVMTSSKLL